MVPQDVIQQLNSIPIGDIFARYGYAIPSVDGTYPCPFHGDKAPSMQIKDNTFFCHSCFAGSADHDTIKSPSVISAVMALGNMTFPQAVDEIGGWYGIDVPKQNNDKPKKVDPFLEGILIAEERFHQNLLGNEKMLSYLHERGMTDADIRTWRIGFGDTLDERYRYLEGRIVFPLRDERDRLVSFTGRLPYNKDEMDAMKADMKDKGKRPPPKYLDRVQGFVKNDHLFGIDRASQAIRTMREAYITEGWTDVISLHRTGVHQTVSSMGLGLSKRQLDMLRLAGAKTLVLIRDGDTAGMKAMLRDIKRAHEAGFEVKVILLDEGMDADDICRLMENDPFRLYNYFLERTYPAHLYPVEVAIRQSQGEIDYYLSLYTASRIRQADAVRLAIDGIEDPSLRGIAREHADHRLNAERGTQTWLQQNQIQFSPNQ